MALSKEFVLLNKTGLHARPAANLVRQLSNFKSDIQITYNNKTVDAKSFISVTSLGAEKDAKILVTIDGPDEQNVMPIIEDMIKNKFGEEE